MREQIQENAWKRPKGPPKRQGVKEQRERAYFQRRPVYFKSKKYRNDDSDSESSEEDNDDVFDDIVSTQYNTPDCKFPYFYKV